MKVFKKVKPMISYGRKIYLMFLISFFIILMSISLFWIGYHNIDIGMNMMNIKELNPIDIGIDGILRNADEAYITGVNQIIKAFIYLFISSIIFGMLLMEIFNVYN